MPLIVPGSGSKDAKIVFVGEAPGREEESQGLPFVGSSGNLLNKVFEIVGINRHECYFTNVVKIRPGSNDFSQFYLDGDKRRVPSPFLEQSIKELHVELKSLTSANIICPLGSEALRAILGPRAGGIDAWRGSILSWNGRKLCGTYHPAYVLRVYEDMPIFELDLRRVRAESASAVIDDLDLRIEIDPSFERCIDYLRQRPERLSFDIETTYGKYVRCVGFSHDGHHAISIPFMSDPDRPKSGGTRIFLGEDREGTTLGSHWTEEQEYAILAEMSKLFSDRRVKFIAHNAPFDMTVLMDEFGFVVNNMWMDTMLAWHCCYPELRKALDFLVSICTKIPYYSNYNASSDSQTWTYNCYDALGTIQVADDVIETLKHFNVHEYYFNQTHPSMLAYTRAQNRGVKVDEEERQRQRNKLIEDIAKITEDLKVQTADPNFNPDSPKQMGEFLYGKLKLEVQRSRKTKAQTVDKHAMERLAQKYPQQEKLFKSIKEHGSKSNVLSGFFNLKLPTGRVFTSYNSAGTITGRLASSQTFIHPDDSTNLQNIRKPSKAPDRRCFIADDGYVILKSDLSQAEFRLVVWFAKIRRLIEKYLHDPNYDCHRWAGSLIFKKPEADITKAERDIAKGGVYGGNYRMEARTASQTYEISFEQAKFVLEAYRAGIPELAIWWKEIDDLVTKQRVLINPLGMRRHFFGRPDNDMFRSAYAYLPSSTVGGIINRSASICDEVFDPTECPLLLQVHDELVFQCRKDLVGHYAPLIINSMEYPIYIDGVKEPLIIPAELTVGPNWMDAKTKWEDFVKQQQEIIKCPQISNTGFPSSLVPLSVP